MSGSTAKQTRRAVRRVVGDQAVSVIRDLQESQRLLANSLDAAHKRIDALETKIDALERK